VVLAKIALIAAERDVDRVEAREGVEVELGNPL
jgi:hypothetical protein